VPRGDWDVAVFDKATGAVVALPRVTHSRTRESFGEKGNNSWSCRAGYGGSAREAQLGVDFLA